MKSFLKFSVFAFGALFIIAFLYTRNLYSTCYIIKQCAFPIVVLFFIVLWTKKNSPVSKAKKNFGIIFDKMIEDDNTKLPNGGDLYVKHYDIHLLHPVKKVYKEKHDYYINLGGNNKLKVCYIKLPYYENKGDKCFACFVMITDTCWYLTDKDATILRA